jgi:hypothetical protein
VPGGSTFEYYLAQPMTIAVPRELLILWGNWKKASSFIRTEDFLNHLQENHQRYLKTMSYVSFGQNNSNRYNCLPRRPYALLLDHFDIDYKD